MTEGKGAVVAWALAAFGVVLTEVLVIFCGAAIGLMIGLLKKDYATKKEAAVFIFVWGMAAAATGIFLPQLLSGIHESLASLEARALIAAVVCILNEQISDGLRRVFNKKTGGE